MDLESIEFSKIVLLVQLTRPRGQLFRPLAAAALANRYKFQKLPGSLEEMQSNPVTFKHGLFQDIAIEQLDIYNDGVIATSASRTDSIRDFLNDFLDFSQAELGAVVSPLDPLQWRYESCVVVQMAVNRDKVLPWAGSVERQIGETLMGYGAPTGPALHFGAARLIPAPGITGIAPFLLEPRVGRNPSLNLFYSAAPLKTDDHLVLLRDLEKRLAG